MNEILANFLRNTSIEVVNSKKKMLGHTKYIKAGSLKEAETWLMDDIEKFVMAILHGLIDVNLTTKVKRYQLVKKENEVGRWEEISVIQTQKLDEQEAREIYMKEGRVRGRRIKVSKAGTKSTNN